MKKNYGEPIVEVVEIAVNDVVTASTDGDGDIDLGGESANNL